VRPYYNEVWFGLSISPDGRRAAVQIDVGTKEIWIYDIERGTMTRLPAEGGSSQAPIWTPDGKRITYMGHREGLRNIYWRNADGTGVEERLTTGENQQIPHSWSREGNLLSFQDLSPTTSHDIWLLRRGGDPQQEPLLNSSFAESNGYISPDGRWLAYASNESGRGEVYVQPFPEPGPREMISTEGGSAPFWAHSGRELFFRSGDKMMVVERQTPATFRRTVWPRRRDSGRTTLFDGSACRAGTALHEDQSRSQLV
jgi:Tol biopolymer transport system component